MNICIIAVGRLKEDYLSAGVAEYLKRLQAYAKVEIRQVKDIGFAEPLNESRLEEIKQLEALGIQAAIPPNSYVICLDEKGQQLSSLQLAHKFSHLALSRQGKIAIIIGGALGLAKDLVSQSDFVMSFSRLTFPHQLMRVILLEQIYRALTIIRKEPYHK